MASDSGPRESDWEGVRLHVVTGKGGTGKTTVAAALALALAGRGPAGAARRGRGPAGHRPALRRRRRCRTRSARSPSRRGGGEVYALAVDAEAALLEYLEMFYKLGRAGAALRADRRHRLRHHDRARACATCCSPARSTRRYAGARRPSGRRVVRRGRARRPADRPDRPLPQRQRRGRRAGQGRARSAARPTSIMRLLHVAADRRALVTLLEEMPVQETVDAHRASCRRPGCRSAAIVVNMVRAPLLQAADLDRRGQGPARPRPRCAAGLAGRRASRVRRRRRRRRCSTRRAEHAERVALEKRERRSPARRWAGRRTSCRCSPTASTSAGSTSWPSALARAGRRHDAAAPARADAARARRRRAARRPGDPDHRLLRLRRRRQDHHRGRARRCARPSAGRKVVVLTIDPARRLAQSMGLTELDNTPRPVTGVDDAGRRLARRDDARHEADLRRGRRARTPTRSRPQRSSTNPFYQSLSSAPSPARRSTWRWRSSASCGQADGRRWDLIVVDTPPSPVGAGLPRRPEAARVVPRRPLHPAADGARRKAGGRAYLKVLRRRASAWSPAC